MEKSKDTRSVALAQLPVGFNIVNFGTLQFVIKLEGTQHSNCGLIRLIGFADCLSGPDTSLYDRERITRIVTRRGHENAS